MNLFKTIYWFIVNTSYSLVFSIFPNYLKFKLRSILNRLYKTSPYYKKIIIDSGGVDAVLNNWGNFPLLTKNIIRSQGENIYSICIDKEKFVWLNTGGSTGNPLSFPFYRPRYAPQIENIAQYKLYRMMGYKRGDMIVAIDGRRPTENDIKNNIYWGLNNNTFPFGKFHYSTMYLNNDTIIYYVNSLNSIKPQIVRGYPSGLVTLSLLIKQNNLSLSFIPKGIYLTSENYSEEMVKIISSVFKCPIYGQYGHTESSVFAYRLPDSEKYYCLPLYGYTEILNENDQPCKIGEIGEIVVTGFSNYALPFIRYKTGDLAEYGGVKKDGTVILNKLLGRSVDFLYNSKKEKIYLVGFIFGAHLHAFDVIDQWQLEQDTYGVVKMKIVKGIEYRDVDENELNLFFLKADFKLDITYVNQIPKTIRGKQQFLIQKLI